MCIRDRHSTPSASQDKTELNLIDQSNVTEDSGVQITPISTKCNSQFNNDVMNMLQLILEQQNIKFNEVKSEFCLLYTSR